MFTHYALTLCTFFFLSFPLYGSEKYTPAPVPNKIKKDSNLEPVKKKITKEDLKGLGKSKKDILAPEYKDKFSDLPLDARNFLRRAYSCDKVSKSKGSVERQQKLRCGKLKRDAKKIKQQYSKDPKVQKALLDWEKTA